MARSSIGRHGRRFSDPNRWAEQMAELEAFLFERVYRTPTVLAERSPSQAKRCARCSRYLATNRIGCPTVWQIEWQLDGEGGADGVRFPGGDDRPVCVGGFRRIAVSKPGISRSLWLFRKSLQDQG